MDTAGLNMTPATGLGHQAPHRGGHPGVAACGGGDHGRGHGPLGALQACKRSAVLNRVQSVLTDSGYTGEPCAGVCEVLGVQVTVQIAKRSELHTPKSAQALDGGAQLCWLDKNRQAIEELRALAHTSLQFVHFGTLALLLRRS